MFIWAIVGAIIIAVLCVLYWMPVGVEITFEKQGEEEEGKLRLRSLFGLIHIHRKLEKLNLEVTEAGPSVVAKHRPLEGENAGEAEHAKLTPKDLWDYLRNWDTWVSFMRDVSPLIRRGLKRCQISTFDLSMELGTGEVISTGMCYGATWSILGMLIGFVSSLFQIPRPPKISVIANFQQPTFTVGFVCIIRFRAGHAMVTLLRIVAAWRRRKKHGSPHSRTHADSHVQHSGNG